MAVGSRRSRIAGAVRRLGDPSYGVYLWSFPVQQLLVAFASLPLVPNIGVVLVVSALLGYASWHLVEKRAIALGARAGVPARALS